MLYTTQQLWLWGAMSLALLTFIFCIVHVFHKKNSFAAFSCRLFSVLRFESVIHEFDPYFNYRTTRFLTEEGFYKFHNWFDDRAWYPLGRIIGGTIYPGESLWIVSLTKSITSCRCIVISRWIHISHTHTQLHTHHHRLIAESMQTWTLNLMSLKGNNSYFG